MTPEERKEYNAAYYKANREKAKQYARDTYTIRKDDPEFKKKRNAYNEAYRIKQALKRK